MVSSFNQRFILGLCSLGFLLALVQLWLSKNDVKTPSSYLMNHNFRFQQSEVNHLGSFDNDNTKQKDDYITQAQIKIGKGDEKNLKVLLKLGAIEPASDKVKRDTKIILWHTPTRYHPNLSKLHPLRVCPQAPCSVTTNRYFYNQSSAVIFAAQILEPKPPVKLSNQVWILHNHEPPFWVKPTKTNLYKSSWISQFNWTLDYRDDADLEVPYGFFRKTNGVYQKRKVHSSRNYTDILSQKNATIAWMVSNCGTMSKRREYVNELRKYVTVDIFGNCGPNKCPRSKDGDCLAFLSKHYKFYLAFENGLCKDYISEKFFRYFNSDVIMISRGGGNYSRVAPPGTYINTGDFESPKHLADYINMLNTNDNEYLKILRLKDQYETVMENWPIVKQGEIKYMVYRNDAKAICEVCSRLWNVDKYMNHYKDIREWFNKGLCHPPDDIPKQNNKKYLQKRRSIIINDLP